MKPKQLIGLAVAAVVLVVLAVLSRERDTVAPPSDIGKTVLPDLAVNDAAELRIETGDSALTVHKVDGTWRVAEKHDYPANFERVRNALITLSDLKVGSVVNVDAPGREALGIAAPGPDAPDATRVVLSNAAGGEIASLILGKQHMMKARGEAAAFGGEYPDGRYVARDPLEAVYRVQPTLSEFTTRATDWMDRELVNADAGKWTRITVTGPGRT